MIEAWHVREALRSRFGSALVDRPGIWEKAAALLRNFAPYRDTFSDLAASLEDVLFNTVYEQLGPSMGAQMDNGAVRRIRSAEFRDASDDVMGVLFDHLKVYSVTFDSLHQYCMDTGSFSAMRTLYLRFGEFMTGEERRILARVIRGARPRSDWEGWLGADHSVSGGGL